MNGQLNLEIGIAVAGIVLLVFAWLVRKGVKRRRARKLRDQSGPEYDAAHERYGGEADAKLQERMRRVEGLRVRPLTRDERERFEVAWYRVQARFVDDPALSVAEADRL